MNPVPARPDPSDAILARLTGLHPKLIDLSLERIWRLLEALGHPQKSLPPVFHVAGTNGKGSLCAYLRSCLEASGYRVHTYTSPHLVHFHERIRLAGGPGHSVPVDEARLCDLLTRCEEANQGQPITFFEITTAAALLGFSEAPADAVILEVGLGGRFDTTNVIEAPLVTALTPISLDHQSFLGDSLAEIAETKAGILRRDRPCVVGPQPDEAMMVIEQEAEKVGAPLSVYGQDWMVFEEHGRLVFQDEDGLLDLPLPGLAGPHQVINAGIALAALRAAPRFDLPGAALERGLSEVVWPARLQKLETGPLVAALPPDCALWLDGGHNVAAAEALVAALRCQKDDRPLRLILGMLKNKDADGFLAPFRGFADQVTTIDLDQDGSNHSADTLTEMAQAAGFTAQPASNLMDALRRTARAGGPARILICGSLHLAGHVLRENG